MGRFSSFVSAMKAFPGLGTTSTASIVWIFCCAGVSAGVGAGAVAAGAAAASAEPATEARDACALRLGAMGEMRVRVCQNG